MSVSMVLVCCEEVFTHNIGVVALGTWLYVLIVNVTVLAFSMCDPASTVTLGCFSPLTLARQWSLSHAYVHSSFHVVPCGMSINMSPSDLDLNMI